MSSPALRATVRFSDRPLPEPERRARLARVAAVLEEARRERQAAAERAAPPAAGKGRGAVP